MKSSSWRYVLLLAAAFTTLLAACSDDTTGPIGDRMEIVADAEITPDNGTIMVDRTVSDEPAWLVVRRSNGDAPELGWVIGKIQVVQGTTEAIQVPLDSSLSDGETLWLMLHADDGQEGVFEYEDAGSLDQPLRQDGELVMTSFVVNQTDPDIDARDQLVQNNTVNVRLVQMPEDGWVVIHDNVNGAPGPVLGFADVRAGLNNEVFVPLDASDTMTFRTGDTLWAMLHYDRGIEGTYEFPGPDVPVQLNGAIVMSPFVVSGPADYRLVVPNQSGANNVIVALEADVTGASWLVIRRDDGSGSPDLSGNIGYRRLPFGDNDSVAVTLTESVSSGDLLWAAIHIDSGIPGTYEYPSADPVAMSTGESVMMQFQIE